VHCGAKSALALALLLCACSSDDTSGTETPADTDGDGTTGGSDGETGSGSSGATPSATVTYANFGDAFLRDWCRGCHSASLQGDARSGAPPSVDFNTHEDAGAWADRIEARALGNAPTMPPASGPSPQELKLLSEWLAAGVP